MLSLSGNSWVDQIAAITTRPEFQRLMVQLVDPALVVSDYDIETGEETVTKDGVIWTGQARLVSQRWGVNRENSDTANSNTRTSILIQFPQAQNFGTVGNPVYRLRRGITLTVLSSPSNPALLTRVFTCTSDMQSGEAAARTIEFESDGDAVAYDG